MDWRSRQRRTWQKNSTDSAARMAAGQRMAQKLSDEEIATVEASLQKAVTQIEVKRCHRGQHK